LKIGKTIGVGPASVQQAVIEQACPFERSLFVLLLKMTPQQAAKMTILLTVCERGDVPAAGYNPPWPSRVSGVGGPIRAAANFEASTPSSVDSTSAGG